ncbi:pirin family protein [Pseudomonas sp. MAP12]|uniref:Pirin family protein n=1 Tax=Geopseudomonas aromaticivorans TaxID=2849492 RepID=A0ABS6MVH0_9GAMM|nr:pirin family protein [Pseudomonas aromaticivorans]MBV2132818.1 pirin family protein [Pseudomonas aromaticivorans]
MSYPHYRDILDLHSGRATSDGAGVRLTRIIGGAGLERFDPVLMLDAFDSFDARDYIGGFPAHPHRGFETVTVMIEGRMRHEDQLGHRGLLEPGGVQWMTAARGIVHSEMPEQEQGRLFGFQLWLNLPAADKMGPAGYRDFAPGEIPQLTSAHGVGVRVIAGRFKEGTQEQAGAVQRPHTEPQLFDLSFPAGACLMPDLPRGHNVLLHVFEGELTVRGQHDQTIPSGQLARLSDGDNLHLTSANGARALLIAARPLHEPIVQYGPFVMNSREEIEQALDDYRNGRFA